MDNALIEPSAAQRDMPTGYTLVLPPGWRQIPIQHDTRKVIRQIARGAFRDLPKRVSRDNVTPYRIELERRLTTAAEQARQHGGTELYMPVELVHGTAIGASFVVSEGFLDAAEGARPADIAAILAADNVSLSSTESLRSVTLDGALGVRTERATPPDRENDYGSRRVDYVLAIPGNAPHWLLFAFSALGAGDPDDRFAKLLVELFDAVMSTFRWTQQKPHDSHETRFR